MTGRLHPLAWWLWAGGLVGAATQTTNPLLLALIIAVACLVVASRGTSSPWAGGYRTYLLVAAAVIAIRMVFRLLLGGGFGTTALIQLPHLRLPAGIELGGTVTAEEMLAGLYDGLRLAAILVAIGAANTLADPRRLLPSLPRALGGIATSAVVALSLAPQLVQSLGRVRRARRLRGESGTGFRSLRSLLVPVLEDSLHRSLALAESMDTRGYGRSGAPGAGLSPLTRGAIWLGLGAVCFGLFALLTGVAPPAAGLLIVGGVVLGGLALDHLGRHVVRTRYRPDRWGGAEWMVAISGVAAAVGLFLIGVAEPTTLTPSLQPLEWPTPGPFASMVLLIAAVPAIAARHSPRRWTRPVVGKAA